MSSSNLWQRLCGWAGRAALVVGLLAGTAGAMAAPGSRYDYYLTGIGADFVPAARPSRPTIVMMGGGTDVDEAFKWMIAKAGGGDFVVIRVTGADGYNAYLYDMGGLDSVETLVLKTRAAASDPFVLERVRQADAVFIAGGDQSDYVRLWKGTPLEAELQALAVGNVPIGGTSAGLAVLGQFDYTGQNGSVSSDAALADPYDRRVTLDRDFLEDLPSLAGTITDSHLHPRERMGRLVVFLGRLIQDRWVALSNARGIGVDSEAALLVEDGIARLVRNPGTSGSAYFLRPQIAPDLCEPGEPLTLRNVDVHRLSGSGRFDLRNWLAPGGATTHYDLSALAGVLYSTQPGGAIY